MNRALVPEPEGGLLRPWRGSPQALLDAALGRGPCWWLRGSRMRTRSGLMDEWAAAAQFPPHFGGTWDALRDALADLPGGGRFLVLEADQLLQDEPPEARAALVAVLRQVREDLAPHGFQVLLQAEGAAYDRLVAGLADLER